MAVNFPGLTHAQSAHRPATRDHDGFAGELSRPVSDDEDLRGSGWPQGLNLATDDREERHVLVADIDEDLSARDRATPPARRDTRHLRAGQRRKQPFGV
jgi:hypothetical protein